MPRYPARAAGMQALTAMSAIGTADGSASRFVASPSGVGELAAMSPAGLAGVSVVGRQTVPSCLLDAYEVHLVLAYHQDGETCGDNPCAPDTIAEHLAWMFVDGGAL